MNNNEKQDQDIESSFESRKQAHQDRILAGIRAIEYCEMKINGYSLNEKGRAEILSFVKNYEFEDILEAIDISERQYLRYDENGNPENESVGQFFSKLGGILYNRSRPPTDEKISHLLGICKKSYTHWDQRVAAGIVSDYVDGLKYLGWSEEEIIKNIDEVVIPNSIKQHCWQQWRKMIEGWTEECYEERE